MSTKQKTALDTGRRQLLKGTAVTSVLIGAQGCGWLLYPERRGRTSGRIDVGVLIVDLLWLLPGLLPGAICLAVDFTTGCIYYGGGVAEGTTPTDETIVAEVDLDKDVVAKGALQDGRRATLEWNQSMDKEEVRGRGRLVFRRADGRTAEAFIKDLI